MAVKKKAVSLKYQNNNRAGGNSNNTAKIKMKTTVKFNKENQLVQTSTTEKLQLAKSENLIAYLNEIISYEDFCKNQTKTGQARKNERARARQKYSSVVLSEASKAELDKINQDIFIQKDSEIEKIEVEITYDGRKANNLGKIIEGVKMAVMVGGISQQYYGIGLIDFKIK